MWEFLFPGPVLEPTSAVSPAGVQQAINTGAHMCWPSLGLPYIFCEQFSQPSQALSCLLKRLSGFSHTWEEIRRYQEQKDILGTENNRCKGPEAGVNVGNASCLLSSGMEGQKQQVRRSQQRGEELWGPCSRAWTLSQRGLLLSGHPLPTHPPSHDTHLSQVPKNVYKGLPGC